MRLGLSWRRITESLTGIHLHIAQLQARLGLLAVFLDTSISTYGSICDPSRYPRKGSVANQTVTSVKISTSIVKMIGVSLNAR